MKFIPYISFVKLIDMLVKLESVASVLDTKELIVYPMNGNDSIDLNMGVELIDVDSEWFQSLSEEDSITVSMAEINALD